MTTQEILKECKVEGLVVKLPDRQLDRKAYVDVKKALELIGGKWKGGKVAGFVFATDPSEHLGQIQGGVKVNLKQEYQFFATPDNTADELVQLACLSGNKQESILEPSAGQGAIVKAINRQRPDARVYCCETMDINRTFLAKIPTVQMIGNDFLATGGLTYDRIIANPPFTKNQDIDHIRHMYDCLKEGGILVSIASAHWQKSTNKKETQFREWLGKVGAEIVDLPAGTFKESGTNVSATIIKIRK